MAGGSDDPTLLDTQPADDADRRQVGSVPPNYDRAALIGRGGMGEVVAAHDRRIGRDVAIKRMRATSPDEATIARFLREAQIQARLDHPAIVPVYELGTDPSGLPYFTMKRLAGTTLQARINADAAPQPLLRAFAEACRAIELAHARGVVHRDLKPENIMLGDYGEVYVIDWGLARDLGTSEGPPSQSGNDAGEHDTIAGSMLGTPGYMSPEQVRDASSVGRPTDVYALGSILFEMLAGAPLHPRGVESAIDSTLAGVDGSPSRRAPDRRIAVELDSLCMRALASDATARPTAGELARAVEHYLDGDRDYVRRREMAGEQLAVARTALAAGARGEAMRAAGRALALDSDSREAAELVTALMLEPPARPSPELQAAIEGAERKLVARHAPVGAGSYAAFVLLLPLAIWSGVKSWPLLIATVTLAIALAVYAFSFTRRKTVTSRALLGYMFGNALITVLLERLFGPFVFVPALACVSTMSLMSYPLLAARMRLLVVCQLAAWVIPVVLEFLGVLSSTWELHDHKLAIESRLVELGGGSSEALLLVTSAGFIVVGGLLAGAAARARIAAQRELMTRDWHLRQLLPSSRAVDTAMLAEASRPT
jgi:serine/threonine-protein kinase